MLYYALVFFVIALLAALFGFTGIAIAFAGIARLLFFLFVILFIISLVASLMQPGHHHPGPPPV
jgi:uncharacterized membrane protein YtjA (UPF0391 family)